LLFRETALLLKRLLTTRPGMLCYIRGGAKKEVKPGMAFRGWGIFSYNLLQTKYFRECNTPADYGKKKDHGWMDRQFFIYTLRPR
jgi:hypothetical protein